MSGREGEVAIDDGAAYPVSGLLHRCFGEPDDAERWKAIADMNFDADQRRLDA